MVKLKYITLAFAGLFLIILSVLASASFEVGEPNHSIDKIYGPSETIRGWINLSLSGQSGNSLFEDSFGNSIKLIDLLKKRDSYNYECAPSDCSNNYFASEGESEKIFDLSGKNSTLYGLKLTGNVIAINSIKFTLESNAQESCESQIKIDILDDGINEIINDKSGEGSCPELKNYECYKSNLPTEEYTIGNTPYCQKIKLSESPSFKVGAWVKKLSGNLTVDFSIYNKFGEEVGSCTLPDASGSGSEISCDIDYLLTESEEHYVCIYSTSGTGNYKIRGNPNPSEGCGFFKTGGLPPLSTLAAYQIFAEGKKFGSVGTITSTDLLSDGRSIKEMVNDYLVDRYSGYTSVINCSGQEGCVVPIRIISGVSQQATLKNLSIEYEKEGVGIVEEKNFYEVSETPARITSEFQRIYIDEAEFKVPVKKETYDYLITLDEFEIFSDEINVESIPEIISIRPTSTASFYPTEFTVTATSVNNITSYVWDFGDEETRTTTSNKATHTYISIKNYNLTIKATDNKGFSSSKTFNIAVSSPKNLINTTLIDMKSNLEKIKNQISVLGNFVRSSINGALDIGTTESEISRLETAYSNAVSDDDYNQIIKDLLKLNVPESIDETAVANQIFFFPERKNVNTQILSVLGGNYNPNLENQYKESILFWHNNNLDTTLNFKEFSAEYGQSNIPLLKVFELNVNEKNLLGYNYYLVLPELENLEFEGLTEKNSEGYVYIEISGKNKISFSTTEDITFIDLPLFITPGVEMLSITDSSPERTSGTTYFIAIIALLLVIALTIYVFLQQWYKKKYEEHLFKNKNDLYNMVHYVNNAKKKGLDKEEIRRNLRRTGWNSEQVRYVVRKYAGKGTGMLEFPIKKILKKVERKREHQ